MENKHVAQHTAMKFVVLKGLLRKDDIEPEQKDFRSKALLLLELSATGL